MLKVKPGVDLRLLQPQMLVVLIVANEICQGYGLDCTITSGRDSHHSQGSLHYLGLAVDLRDKHMTTSQVSGFVQNLKESLGSQYDVVAELDHVHVEFDPK